MNRIVIENNVFIYASENSKKILLDCNDYLANKSRVPMQSVEGEDGIPNIILGLFRDHLKFIEGIKPESNALEYLLLDVKIISYLIQSPSLVRVLEVGCENGMLSYHLATLLGRFHKESSLCCVCDTIGNDSGNQWLDRIALVEAPPKLSMLAADYDDTNLSEEHFDIVIINGSSYFKEPYNMLKEAERLVKTKGIIICYAEGQPLLESCFKLLHEEREEYQINNQNNIMVVTYEGKI